MYLNLFTGRRYYSLTMLQVIIPPWEYVCLRRLCMYMRFRWQSAVVGFFPCTLTSMDQKNPFPTSSTFQIMGFCSSTMARQQLLRCDGTTGISLHVTSMKQ